MNELSNAPVSPSRTNNQEIIVIGGGIIGLFSAYYLLKAGFKVTILEQGDLSANCSSGNAGMIVPSHFVPLAAPGMISKGIKWMFDSKSPFYIKPSLRPDLISWGLKFWKYSNQRHVDASAIPLRDLHLSSKSLYLEVAKEAGFGFGLAEKGILMLYKSDAVAEEEIHLAKKAQDMGLAVDILTAEDTQALEPFCRLNIKGAVHCRCDAHLNPSLLVNQLVGFLESKGVEILTHTKVTGFEQHLGKITAVHTKEKQFKTSHVVMTGGAWLPEIAAKADLKIPVMPGKGYSFKVENSPQLIHPALLLEARVALTPMNEQVRFGGTMEIAPINHRININRIAGIVNAIPNYYPDYKVEMPILDKIWYGFRPCSPDGLPYIGRSAKVENLVVAGGHGMMGVSLAPITGKLVAELVADVKLSVDISRYSPSRFG